MELLLLFNGMEWNNLEHGYRLIAIIFSHFITNERSFLTATIDRIIIKAEISKNCYNKQMSMVGANTIVAAFLTKIKEAAITLGFVYLEFFSDQILTL